MFHVWSRPDHRADAGPTTDALALFRKPHQASSGLKDSRSWAWLVTDGRMPLMYINRKHSGELTFQDYLLRKITRDKGTRPKTCQTTPLWFQGVDTRSHTNTHTLYSQWVFLQLDGSAMFSTSWEQLQVLRFPFALLSSSEPWDSEASTQHPSASEAMSHFQVLWE